MSVALFIQHATRKRRIILQSVTSQVLHILPHYFLDGTIFRENVLNIKYVCSAVGPYEKSHLVRRIQ
jgi:hypothetical protein